MPRKFEKYEPDAIDCQTVSQAIGEDFSRLAKLVVMYSADEVIVICRCVHIRTPDNPKPDVQSIARRPLRNAGSLHVMMYSAMLDCWHQLDRGVLAVATTPIERGWNGRPAQPRRRT